MTEMSKYCGEPYSVVYMRQMLKARYGDNIIVTSINGKTDVVTFRYTARYILHEFFEDSKSKCDDDKDGIIKAAANIIRSDIKSLAVSKQVYPLASDVQDTKYNKDYLPRSDYKDSLIDCKTANLWLAYLEMVVLLHRFVRAERTGDWLLHLDTVQRMLPYFAASGHNLYLKSAYIYLSDMLKMKTSHPDIYASFLSGQHVVA